MFLVKSLRQQSMTSPACSLWHPRRGMQTYRPPAAREPRAYERVDWGAPAAAPDRSQPPPPQQQPLYAQPAPAPAPAMEHRAPQQPQASPGKYRVPQHRTPPPYANPELPQQQALLPPFPALPPLRRQQHLTDVTARTWPLY